MNRKRKFVNAGFTLFEVVFVVAIVASVSLLLVHSFSSYTDKTRESNDQQTLRSMNEVLSYYTLTSKLDDHDGNDIKELINTYHGDSFNYTPTLKNSAFFYIKNEQRIILANINDILTGSFKQYTCQAYGDFVVNDIIMPLDYSIGQSPEELFGDGIYMLSESGSVVAEFISGVRGLADSKSKPELANNYYALQRVHEKLHINNPAKSVIANLLEKFSVEHTVFVNDDYWLSLFQHGDSFDAESIVYQNQILTIPMQVESIIIFPKNDVNVPNSVQTIESNSFTQVDISKHKVNIRVPEHAKRKAGAFTDNQLEIINSDKNNEIIDISSSIQFFVSIDDQDPMLQTNSIRVNYHNLNSAQIIIDMSMLPLDNVEFVEIKRVCIEGCSFFQVKAYNENGIFGFMQIELRVY